MEHLQLKSVVQKKMLTKVIRKIVELRHLKFRWRGSDQDGIVAAL